MKLFAAVVTVCHHLCYVSCRGIDNIVAAVVFLYHPSIIAPPALICLLHTAGLSAAESVGIALLVVLITAVLGLVVASTVVLLWLKKKRRLDICWCPKCLKPVSHTNRGDDPRHRKHIQPIHVSQQFVDERQRDDIGYESTYSIATDQQTSTLGKSIQYSVQDILNAIDPTEVSDREDSSMFVSVGSPSCLTGPGGTASSVGGGAGLTAAGGSAHDEMLSNKEDPSSTSSIAMSSTPTLTAVSDVNTEPNTVAPNETEHVPGGKNHEIAAVKDTGFTEEYKVECEIDKDFWGAELDLPMFSYFSSMA